MSFQTYVTSMLEAITSRLNAIDTNSKKIDELPQQTYLDPLSKFHVSRGGISERLEIQSIIDAVNNNSYNQIVSIGEITIVDNELTVPANAQWIINNVYYNTIADTVITIPYALTGLTRTDILVANTLNQIVLVQGTETNGIAVRPNAPIDTVLITEINVSDGAINNTNPPIVGDGSVKRIERGFASIGGNGDLLYLHDLPITAENANIMISGGIGIIKGLTLYPEAKNYQGKVYSIANKTVNDVVLLHDNATATVPFYFSNEADYTIKINEVITFRFNGWGKFEMLSSSMPSVGVSSWDDLTDKPSTFPPTAHAHAISDITGLATELGNKADLVGGKVLSTQLPSYVDDVIEVANFSALPVTGESGKIYITIDNNKTYRWSGSTYVEISSPQIPAVLGLIKIVDKAGDFFTNLATASAYIRNFTTATITNESFSNGTFWFTVPNGSSFTNSNGFLYKLTPHTAYVEDYLELISFLGNNTLGCSSGNSILGNVRFGTNSLVSFSGILRIRNVTLVNKSDTFGVNASGRVEIYGTIGTTTGNDYANFFPTNTAVIWARRLMQTNNGGGIEGDLARAQTNGAKLFFGYADGGATDLSYTASPTNGTVVSSTGTDATIPLADGTNAGLILLDSFGDVVVDTDVLSPPTIGTIAQPTLITPTGSVILNGLPTTDWVITAMPTTVGLTGLTGNTSTTTITGLTEDTTYTFKVTSNGETSVDSANVVIDAQPIPAEYYVRPLGTTYGTGDGTSFANAWSGFTAINWSVLNTKTLNVVGTHNEELNVQQNSVTIVGNNVNGAGIIDAQNTRVCFRINGYNNITVNNLSMINGQTSNAHNMLTTGTIYNNCTFDTSGNQTTQHEGNVVTDLISVTYNGCTFKNGTDDGVSLHGDNTTVVLNNCSMENNSQGVNAINTGVCIINDSNFLNNVTDVQPDSSSDITVNRSTFRNQLSANSSVPLKLNNCTMLSGETVVTSQGSIVISDTKYLGLSKITTNQVDIAKVKITRCYFEVSTIAKVTTINNAVYDLSYSIFKHISGTNVFGASTGGTGTSTINNCTFVGSSSTGRGISAQGRVNVKNTIFQGLNLVVNPNGANGIVTFDKCCTYLNTTINVNQNGGTFTNTSSITTNPLITDIVNLDFSLQSGSSCWNTGATLTNAVGILSANWSTGMPTVTTKTQPATWDIGAYIH